LVTSTVLQKPYSFDIPRVTGLAKVLDKPA
jgi:hypothetical protein